MEGDNNSTDESFGIDNDVTDVPVVPGVPAIPVLPTIPDTVVVNTSARPTAAESRSSSSSTSSSTDPKMWTLAVVHSIRGMSSVSRISGLTVVNFEPSVLPFLDFQRDIQMQPKKVFFVCY